MSGVATPEPRVEIPPSPYKGLTHYTEDDAGFFFGRESERQIIIANLMASRLTLVYGASGVGKSSLLRAAVVRHLRDMAQQDLDEFGEAQFLPVVFTAWKDDPPAELLNCIRVAAENLLGKSLTIPEGRLDEQLAAITEELDTTLLVVCDQFEEYFLYHPQDEGPGTFAGAFPRAVNRRDLKVNFIVSIREDALAMLDRFKGSIPTLFENYLRVDHLKREAAREAIVKPIGEFNRVHPDDTPVEIEPELVDAVLDQIRTGAVVLGQAGSGAVNGGRTPTEPSDDDRVETPYLQLVMSRLWNEELGRGSRVLRLETLKRLGGAQKIVRTHLDEAMGELEPDEQDAAATIFRQLVTPSGTKIAHTIPDLADYARLPPDELTPVLEHLSGGDVRILRPVAPPPGQLDGGRYEIFHDVLAPAILDWRARYTEKKAREEAERELEETREQARRERRRARIFRAVALVAIACAVLAAILGLVTRSQGKTARSRGLAAQAVAALNVDPAQSVNVALAAIHEKRTRAAEEALRRVLGDARERLVLHGHKNWVNSVAFSPDGKRVVTGSDDQTVRIWDAETGRRLLKLDLGQGVNGVAFSGDGRFVAAGGDGGRVRVWASENGHVLAEKKSLGEYVSTLAFDPSSRKVLTTNGDRAYEWDWLARTVRALDDGERIVAAAYGRGGRIVTGADTKLRLWNAKTGKPMGAPVVVHGDVITSVEFSPDGRYVVSGSEDKTAEIWDTKTKSPAGVLGGNADSITGAAFSPDGNLIATSGQDGTARLWEWRSQQPLYDLSGHNDSVLGVAFSPDGRRIATASADRTVRLWDAAIGRSLFAGYWVFGVAFSRDSRYIVAATGGPSPAAIVWPASGPESAKPVVLPHRKWVRSAAFSPDGSQVATAGDDGIVRLWNWRTRTPKVVGHHEENVNSVAFGKGGRLVTSSDDGTAIIWPLHGGAAPLPLEHPDNVNDAVFSRDGNLVATASTDRLVRIWNARTGRLDRKPLAGHRGAVHSVGFSRDGSKLVSASADFTSRIWDLSSSKKPTILSGHTGEVRDAVFTPDGKRVVTVGSDYTTRIWDAGTGHLITTLRRHADQVRGVAVSDKGSLIATASDDYTAKIYRCDTCGSIDRLIDRAKSLKKSLGG